MPAKLLLFCCCFLVKLTCCAQLNLENARNARGTLTKGKNVLLFLKSFKVLPASKATSMAATSEKIEDIIASSQRLNPPIGFDAKIEVATSDIKLESEMPEASVVCSLRNLLKDKNTGKIETSMDGADIILRMNDFGIFWQMGNYASDCRLLHVPLFFEQPAFLDSSEEHITFMHKADPLRIVTGNKQPLFVPLTRAEYLKFLIARMQHAIKEENESLETTRSSKATLEKMLTTAKEADRDYVNSSIKTVEYNLSLIRKNLLNEQAEIDNCKAALKNLSPEEAHSPVRVNYHLKSAAPRFGGLSQIVPQGRKEGVALIKINPDYYDRTAAAPVVQLIVMNHAWPAAGFKQDPNYVEQAALNILDNLDYHALKLAMKNP